MNRVVAVIRSEAPGLVVAFAVSLVGFTVHRSVDVVSPHVVAVAIGIVDGVGYGENTKASIITRGAGAPS